VAVYDYIESRDVNRSQGPVSERPLCRWSKCTLNPAGSYSGRD
jgi:hypothetical protein